MSGDAQGFGHLIAAYLLVFVLPWAVCAWMVISGPQRGDDALELLAYCLALFVSVVGAVPVAMIGWVVADMFGRHFP